MNSNDTLRPNVLGRKYVLASRQELGKYKKQECIVNDNEILLLTAPPKADPYPVGVSKSSEASTSCELQPFSSIKVAPAIPRAAPSLVRA